MPFPLQTYLKDPQAILDYSFDWEIDDWLGTDTIATVTWTLPAGITSVSTISTTTRATNFLSGGVAGTDYDVACKILTAGSREDKRTMRLQVRQR